MPPERCRYNPEVRGDPDLGRIACWRPVHEDNDRCIWHSEQDDKSDIELVEMETYRGERLDGAVLTGLDLQDATIFADCVLIGADFTGTNVSGADLRGADMRESFFTNVTATKTDFRDAHLEGATMAGSDLRYADMRRSRLHSSDLTSTLINDETRFGDCVVYERDYYQSDDAHDRADNLERATRMYRILEDIIEE